MSSLPVEVEQTRPASFAQEGLWLVERLDEPGPLYNIPIALRLTGPCDVSALGEALYDVVARHETLRTLFVEREGSVLAQILRAPAEPTSLPVAWISADALADQLSSYAAQPFNLAAEPPFRAQLWRLAADEHVLMMVFHHIATDGASERPFFEDLCVAYKSRRAGKAPSWESLPTTYHAYAQAQRAELSETLTAHREFWAGELAELPERIDLPTDHSAARAAGNRTGASVSTTLSSELVGELAGLAKSHRASMFMVVLTALTVLLKGSGAGRDIPVGTVAAGRDDEDLEPLVGCFINTVLIRTQIASGSSFADLLEHVRHRTLRALDHQGYPFALVAQQINEQRRTARAPLYQVMLSLHNEGRGEARLDDLRISRESVTGTRATCDLMFSLAQSPSGTIDVELTYDAALFGRMTANRLARGLHMVLSAAAREPDIDVDRIRLLDETERDLLLAGLNSTSVARSFVPAHQRIAEHAAIQPDALAVIHGATQLTYGALNDRADEVACLLSAHKIGVGDLVAVAMPRSHEAVAALLGILKSGAAYLPLDPDNPPERQLRILSDAEPKLVLTSSTPTSSFNATRSRSPVRWLCLDEANIDPRTAEATRPSAHVTVHPADTAYLIYTSGSTGVPKGVAVPHSSLGEYIAWCVESYRGLRGFTLLHSSLAFDLTVTTLWGTLAAGGCLVVSSLLDATPDEESSVRGLRISFMKATPSHLAVLGQSQVILADDAEVLLGGEALTGVALHEWRRTYDRAAFYDVYGPTECTVNCAETRISPGELIPTGAVPIGRPQANTRLYVLDENLEPTPPGVTGELYVAGARLALGYRRRPTATCERFVADPFGPPGTRMYRTGDLARWNSALLLEYMGRADDQVKIRGHRVEPGEIEALLLNEPDVVQAAVVVREDPVGHPRLVGYVVTSGRGLNPEALQSELKRHLPPSMVPTIVVLPSLPLTRNGKLDRAVLPAPEQPVRTSGRAPWSGTEEVLCELFSRALGRPHTDVHDGFFDLGGHSLTAVQLLWLVQSELGLTLTMRDLFEASTPAALTRRVSTGGSASPFEVLLPIRAAGRGEHAESQKPLFCFHPGSGLCWGYSGLLRHLSPDTPLYGIQSFALTEMTDLPETLEEMAARYAAQIRAVCPSGPYRLLGYSFGGLTAHAAAVALQEAGEEVEFLSTLDAYPRPELVAGLGHVVGATALPERDPRYEPVLEAVDAIEEQAVTRALRYHYELRREHRPRVFDGDLLAIRARRNGLARVTQTAAWRPYVDGAIEEVSVDCDHFGLLDKAPLELIGRAVAGRLSGLRPSNDRRAGQVGDLAARLPRLLGSDGE